MPIAVGPALLISSLIGAGGAVAGGLIGSSAAKKAAQAQADSAKYAADLQKQSADQSLAFQKDEWTKQQQDIAPWLSAGTTALSQLGTLTAPGGQLAQPFKFDSADFTGDPGYQFRLAEGQKALEHAASARGNLLGGATQKSLDRFSQDYASNEYDRAYNRAFNTFNVNNTNLFNRLSSLSGTGQQATALLGSEGGQASANVANILGTEGNSLANLAVQGGNARASGYVGSANAINGGFSGVGNAFGNYALINAFAPQNAGRVNNGRGINPFSGGFSYPPEVPNHTAVPGSPYNANVTNPFSYSDLSENAWDSGVS